MLTYAEAFLNETYPGAEEMPTKMIQAMTSDDPEKSVQSQTLLSQEEEVACDPASSIAILETLNKELKNDSCPSGFDLLEDKSCVHRSYLQMTIEQAERYCSEMQGSYIFVIEKIEDLEAIEDHNFKISGIKRYKKLIDIGNISKS